MTAPRRTFWPQIAAIGSLLAALALAGCGVKGPVEEPPEAQGLVAPMPGTVSQNPKRSGPIQRPKQPFILDGLL